MIYSFAFVYCIISTITVILADYTRLIVYFTVSTSGSKFDLFKTIDSLAIHFITDSSS